MKDKRRNRSRKRVVLVDKLLLLHTLLNEELKAIDYEMLGAQCCEEAIEIIQKRKDIDLIITSIEFPGKMNGLDFVKWLTKNVPEIPVIIFSATNMCENHRRLVNLPRECVTKSWDLTLLMDAVKRQTK